MTSPILQHEIQMLNDNLPGLEPGYLEPKGQKGQRLPLAGLHVKGQVLGSVIDVELRQTFQNTGTEPIEAVYIFPLPGAAAVYSFELKVAERLVAGEVQERHSARQAYQQALQQGHRAALMEQERDDVYSLQVGNIPAGERVEVCLKYVQQLDYRAQGLYECRVPTVVAPRYIPGQMIDQQSGLGTEPDTDLVPDASRITPPRLVAGFDPRVDLSIEIALEASSGLSELACTQHASSTGFENGRVLVKLAQQERLNRDFVLRWRSTQAELSSKLYYLAGPTPEAGFGMLQLQAPAPAFMAQQTRDVVFLVDRSGSMGDYKMAAAAQACDRLLNSLGPNDRFAIQAFDDRIEWLVHPNHPQQVWLQADEQGKQAGRKYLRGIDSRGGTELHQAIQAALKHCEQGNDSQRLPVLVLLTDGQVGDESRILKAIQAELGEALVHTIGIDTALNDAFLQRLARLGGGTHVSVTPREDLGQVLESIAAEIGYPALQQIQLNLPELTPSPVPNLYLGRSLSLFFHGPCPTELSLEAQRQGQPEKISVAIEKQDFPALAQLWAHSRIQQLEDQFRLADHAQKQDLKQQMIAISCEHQVLCRMTAWLAVDKAATIENAEQRHTVVQPVEMPADWDADKLAGAMPAPMPIARAAAAMSMPFAEAAAVADEAEEADEYAELLGAMPAALPPQAPPPPPVMPFPAAMPAGGTGALPGGAPPPAPKLRAENLPLAQAPGKQEGLLQKMLQPFAKRAQAAPEAQAAFDPKPSDRADVAKPLAAELESKIQAFLSSLKAVLQALEQHQAPDWQALKGAHEALTAALQHADQADQLPALQRLLRQESRQLLQALEAGHQGLELLVSRCRQQLQKLEAQQQPVWEQSI